MIKTKRVEKDFSQKELAKKLNTSQSYISRLEHKSVNNLNLKLIKKLAKILDLDFKELINWIIN